MSSQSDSQPEAPRLATFGLALLGAVALLLTDPAASGPGLVSLLLFAAGEWLSPRLRMSQRTVLEIGLALAHAAVLAWVARGGIEPGALIFAASVVVGQCLQGALWRTSALAAVLGAAATVAFAWSGGARLAVAAGLGLLGLGLGVGEGLAVSRRQRAALGRQLQRALGDLEQRKSVEVRLRETHESLERQTIALTRTNRRIEEEIEERRRAEERALEVAQLKDAFLRTVSHELRTPLNAVIGYAEGLLEDEPTRTLADARVDLDRILEASRRLLELIDNILDLSAIETGKAAVAIESVDVAALIAEVADALAPQAARAGSTIRVRCAPDLTPVQTDRVKLRQILVHLLDNACKFTREGVIRIVARVERGPLRATVILEVSDTGVGIEPELLTRIFAPFVQADGSTTRRHGGAGLGLALCRHFCALLGGEIGATSEPGRGSTFTVRLPATRLDPRRDGVVLASEF